MFKELTEDDFYYFGCLSCGKGFKTPDVNDNRCVECLNVKKPFDPEQNVRGGLAYLRWLLAYFRGNVKLVVAAYNAGEGAVNKYLGVPPYAETKAYVQKILAKYTNEVHPFDEAITGPSPELGRIKSKKEKKDS